VSLDRYVGVYELFPGGNVFKSRQADVLMMRHRQQHQPKQ
jgi:hypothetical protein